MIDPVNGLGFEDLDAVETVNGVHCACRTTAMGMTWPRAPLFTFNVLDSINIVPDFFSLASECLGCNPDSVVSFVKPDYATDVVDTITPYVAIARGNNQGLYNAITNDSFNSASPSGTMWKMGPTSEPGPYTVWREAVDWSPPSAVGQTLSMWVPQGNYFFDVTMTSWTQHDEGGGFAYDRTLVDAPTWDYYSYHALEANLVRMLPKHAPNGDDWDWEALAIDVDSQIAYAICDENENSNGQSDQELWSIDLETNFYLEPTPCVGCNPDSVVTFTQEDYQTASAVSPCPECDPDSIVSFVKADYQDLGLLSEIPCSDCTADSVVSFSSTNGTRIDQINPYGLDPRHGRWRAVQCLSLSVGLGYT